MFLLTLPPKEMEILKGHTNKGTDLHVTLTSLCSLHSLCTNTHFLNLLSDLYRKVELPPEPWKEKSIPCAATCQSF